VMIEGAGSPAQPLRIRVADMAAKRAGMVGTKVRNLPRKSRFT
jgi:hypothetical protein